MVAPVLPFRRRGRLAGVAVKPLRNVEVVELLIPEHPGERLALHSAHVFVCDARVDGVIERVRLADVPREDLVEVTKGIGLSRPRQAQAKLDLSPGRHRAPPNRSHLRPSLGGVDGVLAALDDEIIEAVLEEAGGLVALRVEAPRMGLVVAEGQAVGVALRTLFAVLIAALVACAGSSGRSPSSPSPSDPSPAFVAEIALTVADLDGSIRLFRDRSAPRSSTAKRRQAPMWTGCLASPGLASAFAGCASARSA